jgi:hypothetical protein
MKIFFNLTTSFVKILNKNKANKLIKGNCTVKMPHFKLNYQLYFHCLFFFLKIFITYIKIQNISMFTFISNYYKN